MFQKKKKSKIHRKSSSWGFKVNLKKRDKIQQISKSCREYFTTFDKKYKKKLKITIQNSE